MACAPPMRWTSSTPASAAAASVESGMLPSRPGGVASATCGTPATLATSAVIRTVDGYRARPPGT